MTNRKIRFSGDLSIIDILLSLFAEKGNPARKQQELSRVISACIKKYLAMLSLGFGSYQRNSTIQWSPFFRFDITSGTVCSFLPIQLSNNSSVTC